MTTEKRDGRAHDIVGAPFGRAYAYDGMDRLACRQGQPFVIKACVQVDEEAYHKGPRGFFLAGLAVLVVAGA